MSDAVMPIRSVPWARAGPDAPRNRPKAVMRPASFIRVMGRGLQESETTVFARSGPDRRPSQARPTRLDAAEVPRKEANWRNASLARGAPQCRRSGFEPTIVQVA